MPCHITLTLSTEPNTPFPATPYRALMLEVSRETFTGSTTKRG
jgi:hypothetical protein